MPDALPLPLRVAVRGPSTVGWMSGMGGPRSDLGFPRVIERELLAAGQTAEVRSVTVGGDSTAAMLRAWEAEVLGWSPDVIIYWTGQYESLHLLLPRWLERYANSFTWVPGPWQRFYRKRLLRPFWRTLVRAQTRLDAALPAALGRRRMRRAVEVTEHLVTKVRQVGSPLVIVMGGLPPGSRAELLFPGMAERIRSFNGMLAEMTRALGSDDVRAFDTAGAVRDLADDLYDGDYDQLVPDGFHLTPAGHDAFGRALAAEINAWAATQSHLKPPT